MTPGAENQYSVSALIRIFARTFGVIISSYLDIMILNNSIMTTDSVI